MKKITIILALFSLILPAFAEDVLVPKDTTIDISVKRYTTSRHIPKTYELKGALSDDLIIDNIIVASIGNPVTIYVEDFSKAKGFGRGGSLVINGAVFYDNNNQPHKLSIYKTFKGDNDIWLTRIIPFNKGKQAEISPSNKLTATLTTSFKYEPRILPINNTSQGKGVSGNRNTTIQFGIVNQSNSD